MAQGGGHRSVLELIPQPYVEAFDIAILSWTARCDIGALGPDRADPCPHCLGDEFRAVAPTEGFGGRRASGASGLDVSRVRS